MEVSFSSWASINGTLCRENVDASRRDSCVRNILELVSVFHQWEPYKYSGGLDGHLPEISVSGGVHPVSAEARVLSAYSTTDCTCGQG